MINTNIIKSISDGNLEELKKISKTKITEDFSKEICTIMEKKLEDINVILNANTNNDEIKFILPHYYDKKQKIEDCILYLKKIK
jgi:hypothetical protein